MPASLQVEFEKPVDAKGNIEVWLQRLVDGMQDTVKMVSLLAVTAACLRKQAHHPWYIYLISQLFGRSATATVSHQCVAL